MEHCPVHLRFVSGLSVWVFAPDDVGWDENYEHHQTYHSHCPGEADFEDEILGDCWVDHTAWNESASFILIVTMGGE